VVIDADGATIAVPRADGSGIHILDSAHDKAYTSASFKSGALALTELARGHIAAVQKAAAFALFWRRYRHKDRR
jgi:uncharacterized protein GlcG (DUF336 family)